METIGDHQHGSLRDQILQWKQVVEGQELRIGRTYRLCVDRLPPGPQQLVATDPKTVSLKNEKKGLVTWSSLVTWVPSKFQQMREKESADTAGSLALKSSALPGQVLEVTMAFSPCLKYCLSCLFVITIGLFPAISWFRELFSDFSIHGTKGHLSPMNLSQWF